MKCCANCGFLDYYNSDTEQIEHVGEDARKTGRFPSVRIRESMPIRMMLEPMCFAIAANLSEECRKVGGDNPRLAVISKDRADCPEYTKWHPGFSPKEHRAMIFDVEKKKLDLQEKQAERDWTERREKQDRRFQLFNTLVSAFVGAVCTAAIGGAFAWLTSARDAGKPPTAPSAQPAVPLMPAAKE